MARRPNVLVVDDQVMFARLIARAVERFGFRAVPPVFVFDDIMEAITREQPDILLLDVMLGDRSSLDLVPEIRRDHPTIKIIILTGYLDVDLLARADALGCHAFLWKVHEVDELHAAMKAVMVHRRFLSPHFRPADARRHCRLQRPLTHGQRDLFAALQTGSTQVAIAAAGSTSLTSVYRRVRRLRAALGLAGRFEHIRWSSIVIDCD
ncbi:MAG TPA: response regulator [Gemmatimonadales bacterium]|jgi:DNA-binding NarL/FixJ family response regulator|nr:response regulator [Gemmatimonadales bacterium]